MTKSKTRRNNARRRAQAALARQMNMNSNGARPLRGLGENLTLTPMQPFTVPNQLRVNTKIVYEIGQAAADNLWYSSGMIRGASSTVTSGVEQFDSKAWKFFGIYRYWRCVGLKVTVVNNTNATSNATIFVGWAPGDTSVTSIADLMDNDVSMGVAAGAGQGVMVVPQQHMLPNGMWRRTRPQSVVTAGGVQTIFPSVEEVTQGVLALITTGVTGSGVAGVISVESTWEFKEFI